MQIQTTTTRFNRLNVYLELHLTSIKFHYVFKNQ